MPTRNPFRDPPQEHGAQPTPEAQTQRRGQIAEQTQRMRQRLRPYEAAMTGGALTFVDSLLNIPRAVGDVLAIGGAAAESGAALATGRPADFRSRLEAQHEQFPAAALRGLPMPDAIGVEAFMSAPVGQMIREGVGPAVSERREALEAHREGLRQDHPIAYAAGDVGGTLATLLSARAPIAGQLRDFTALRPRTARQAPRSVQREWEKFTNQRWVREAGRGFRKAAETGMEGAVVALLSDGDPVDTAALAAGTQGLGSATMWLARKPVKRLVPTVIGSTLAYQMFTQAAPGIQQNIFESLDASISKVLAVSALGAMSGVAGMGRLPRETQEALGAFGEALTPAMRTPMLRVFSELTAEREREEDTLARFMEQFSEDPDAFGESAVERVHRVLESEDYSEGDLRDLIERINRNPFRNVEDR